MNFKRNPIPSDSNLSRTFRLIKTKIIVFHCDFRGFSYKFKLPNAYGKIFYTNIKFYSFFLPVRNTFIHGLHVLYKVFVFFCRGQKYSFCMNRKGGGDKFKTSNNWTRSKIFRKSYTTCIGRKKSSRSGQKHSIPCQLVPKIIKLLNRKPNVKYESKFADQIKIIIHHAV